VNLIRELLAPELTNIIKLRLYFQGYLEANAKANDIIRSQLLSATKK